MSEHYPEIRVEEVKQCAFFISQQMQEEAGVGSVDCQKYRSFCQEQGVNSYPTIRLYPHNSQGARRFV